MISEAFDGDIYISDFTGYNNTSAGEPVEYTGVTVGTE